MITQSIVEMLIFVTFQHKAASHKSSCLAVINYSPSRDINKNRSCIRILFVVDFWVYSKISKSNEVKYSKAL